MIATLTLIAEVIGFIVLGLVFLLGVLTAVSAIHYFIRTRFPKSDLYLYDENARWNARWRRKQNSQGDNSEPPPGASGDGGAP
jgi:hypothetical protein